MQRSVCSTLTMIILLFSLTLACSPPPPPPPAQPFLFAVRVETPDSAQTVLMDETGEVVVALPPGSTSPSFAADGSYLYYASPTLFGDLEMFQIYRLDLDTRQSARLSDGTTNDDSPSCSRDGERLAFVSQPAKLEKPEDRYWRICLMDKDGQNRRFLDQTGERQQLTPIWSPDGVKIVYVRKSTLEEAEKDKKLKFTLKIYDLNTKTSRNILPEDYLVAYPSWSPQGDRIAFTQIEQEGKSSIWVVRPDGTGAQRLTSDHDDTQASWMPDGRSLLFSRAQGNQRGIYQVNLETLQVTQFLKSQTQKGLEDKKDVILEFPQVFLLPKSEGSQIEPAADEKK